MIQAVYLPTVYYGLEFLTGYTPYVKEIQRHVNDTIRSLFRIPIKLATNILLAETCTVPAHIQGQYLRERCYARFKNYGYCSTFPWTGCIRNKWYDGDMVPVRLTSDQRMVVVPNIDIEVDKSHVIAMHNAGYEDWVLQDDLLIYTDTSKTVDGTRVGYVVFERGMQVERWSCKGPTHWSVMACKLFAILAALRQWAGRWRHHVRIFMDSRAVLMLIEKAGLDGESVGIWDAFCPMFNGFLSVSLCWVPGHVGIHGNEVAKGMAKQSVKSMWEPWRFEGLDFGIGQLADARDRRKLAWDMWHREQGHDYYKRSSRRATHLRGMQRMDAYVLMRI